MPFMLKLELRKAQLLNTPDERHRAKKKAWSLLHKHVKQKATNKLIANIKQGRAIQKCSHLKTVAKIEVQV